MEKCKLIEIRSFKEEKGNLSVLECGQDIDFEIQRCFYIYGVSEGESRGFHANKESSFLMFVPSGSCLITVDNGMEREDFLLDSPAKGLLVEKGTWKEMKNFSSDCVLVVLSDKPYDKGEYIYDYDSFLKEAAKEVKR